MKKIVVIAGVTASGKSALGVKLAHKFNGEIISADSVAIYKGLDIGSAKPSLEEQDGIPHHMIDILEVDQSYSVAQFQKDARALIDDICARGKLPIIVGGTGLYINALIYNYQFDDEVKETKEYSENNDELYQLLKDKDSKSAQHIHPNNRKRVIRALERVANPSEEFDRNESLYDATVVFLAGDRQRIYDRINDRVERMVHSGLVDEVSQLLDLHPNLFEYQSTNSIGYREFEAYFKEGQSLEDTIALIQRNTRRFAKRQITWFTHQTKSEVIDIFDGDDVVEKVSKLIK